MIFHRWSLNYEKCWTRGSKPKNIDTKRIVSHRNKEKYQADTVFISNYLIGNTGQRYLLSINDHFGKFRYATLMHTKTEIEVLAYLKKFLLVIENPNQINFSILKMIRKKADRKAVVKNPDM